MKNSSFAGWVVVCSGLWLTALACGDAAADGCEAFVACGGDPVGVWQSQTACVSNDVVQELAMDLPEVCRRQVTIDEATASTTLTLREDGSFSEEGSLTIDWAMEFREDCIAAAAPGQAMSFETISQFCAVFADTIGPGSPFTSSGCRSLEDRCSCSAQQVVPVSESGTFSVEGTSLVNSDGQSQGFCVDGDRLDVGGASGMPGEGAYLRYERAE